MQHIKLESKDGDDDNDDDNNNDENDDLKFGTPIRLYKSYRIFRISDIQDKYIF